MKGLNTFLFQLGAVYTSIVSACKLNDLPILSAHGSYGSNQCIAFGDEQAIIDRLIDPQACDIPRLIEATADQLQDGLTKGCFTSVDLVKVRITLQTPYQRDNLLIIVVVRPMLPESRRSTLPFERSRRSIPMPLP